MFHQLREYNLELKPSKCSLFKEEINYLAHRVSKQGLRPSDANLRAITECTPPQTYTEICTFLSLIGHYWQFIKGFAWIAQPLNKHLVGEGASRKSEWVSLSEEACPSLCWLEVGFSTRNRCFKVWNGSGTFPKTSRWVTSPSWLW